MTEAEREMMNTIHLYGLILSLDDNTTDVALDYAKAILGGAGLKRMGKDDAAEWTKRTYARHVQG